MENIENEYGNSLKEIKVLLGISDELQDELLTLVIQDSEERILSVLNQYAQKNGTDKYDAVPDSLNYILRDVSIKRFNKRNSEGQVLTAKKVVLLLGKRVIWMNI